MAFVIRWNRDSDDGTGTGYAVFDFKDGVVTGKACNGSAVCPPEGARVWAEGECSAIKTGTYSPDGEALVNPLLFEEPAQERRRLEEVWRGDHSRNNIYWNEPWMAEGATELTDELYGGVYDVAAGTITGIYNGGPEGTRTGTITYTKPYCAPYSMVDLGGSGCTPNSPCEVG
jgi:hypothetical protein